MSELKAVPENADTVLALAIDLNTLLSLKHAEPLTKRAGFGYFICLEAARSAMSTQLEIMGITNRRASPTD